MVVRLHQRTYLAIRIIIAWVSKHPIAVGLRIKAKLVTTVNKTITRVLLIIRLWPIPLIKAPIPALHKIVQFLQTNLMHSVQLI